jgi:tetratricopeptide (TPR) repeat protein
MNNKGYKDEIQQKLLLKAIMKLCRLTIVASLGSLLISPLLPACTTVAVERSQLSQVFTQEENSTQSLTGIAAEVDKIAQQVTVLINSGKSGNGSGAIVAKQGDTYYVLTAAHVIKNPDEYAIATSDGESYPLDRATIKTFEGVDLALFSFNSQKSYPVATLADYEIGLEDRPLVFASGFPATKSGQPVRKLTAGVTYSQEIALQQAQNIYSLTNGYELIYTNISQRGMSGGPVFDSLGRIVGLNAAAEAEWTINDAGQDVEIQLGRSLGVPITTFVGLAAQAQIDPKLMKVETSAAPSLSQEQIDEVLKSTFNEPKPSQDSNEVDWLNWGNQQWRIRNYPEAIAAFDRAIQIKPDFYQAYYAKGLAFYGQEKFAEANTAFDRALQINPNIYEIWRLKAQSLDEEKKPQEALTAIDKAIQLNPDDYVLYIQRGFILTRLERYNDAKTTFSRAVQLNPTYYAYFFRGLTNFNLNDYQNAIADFTKSLELQPNHYSSYVTRGSIYTLTGNFQAAMTDLNKAIEIAPDSNPLKLEVYKARGMLYLGTGNLQNAIADCNKVISGNPENKRLLREGYECLAQASASSGDFQNAIANQTKAIELDPQNAVAYRYRGGFRNQAQDFQNAITDFDKAIALDPNDAEAYSNRATARASLNDMQGAVADTKKAIELYTQKIASNPNNLQLYINRAISRAGIGDKPGAMQDVQKAEQLLARQGITSGAGYELVQKLKNFLLVPTAK